MQVELAKSRRKQLKISAALGIYGAAQSGSDSGFIVDLDTGCYH
ncbi:hypothetical protein J3E61_006847 [Mycobacterium sp. OAE908]